jgi:arginine N-succinyltransferase
MTLTMPTLRDAMAADLPHLHTWLAPGAAQDLPNADDGDEQWIVAAQGSLPVGGLRLRRAIGLDLPRPWFHVGCVVHAAPELGLHHRLHTLQLGNDLTGATELADIVCDRERLDLPARAVVLHALVQEALRRIHAARGRFASHVIVEVPGVRDGTGASPFWNGLGRHFYDGDPIDAARRFGPAWRCHVAALLPRQLIYTSFLDEAARRAIARASEQARDVMDVLSACGLRYGHHVTIDDGGPVFVAPLETLAPGRQAYSPR